MRCRIPRGHGTWPMLAVAFLAVALMPGRAMAQEASTFPSRAVTLVVPFSASSGGDLMARQLAPRLARLWGQSVVVDNKPGASGIIGSALVARAAPDGHTLLLTANTLAITPATHKNQPYDPLTGFSPITKLADAGLALAVNPRVQARDLPALIAHARSQPGQLNYASPGSGTPQHFSMELLKSHLNIDIQHVPYSGISGALGDVIGGQVDMIFSVPKMVAAQAEAGKLRVLAVSSPARSPLLPAVPTLKELGMEGLDAVNGWYMVLAPAKTSPALVRKLQEGFSSVMRMPEVQADMDKLGLSVSLGSPAQAKALIADDMARWQALARQLNIPKN